MRVYQNSETSLVLVDVIFSFEFYKSSLVLHLERKSPFFDLYLDSIDQGDQSLNRQINKLRSLITKEWRNESNITFSNYQSHGFVH